MLLAYFGGLMYLLFVVFGYLLRPISEFSFYLKSGKMLYYAKTNFETLFMPMEDDLSGNLQNLTRSELNELENHKKINLSNKRRCCTYCCSPFKWFLRCFSCINEKYE